MKPNSKLIKAKELPVQPIKEGFIQNFLKRFSYDIKQAETWMGKYNVDTKVVLQHNALMKAVIYCAVTLKTQGRKEIMGWLAGKRYKDRIEIIDAYIGNCESSASYTELDPRETIRLNKMARERGLVLVGQWHTHPGMSTTPSSIDDDFMKNIEKFGMKTPVQLIVNTRDFNLSIVKKGRRKKVDFIIPPKIDTSLDINLGYINGEYKGSPFGYGYGFGYGSDGYDMNTNELVDFCGWVGNKFLIFMQMAWPWINFKKWVVK